MTNYYPNPSSSTKPEVSYPAQNKTKYTYYLRSKGTVDNHESFVKYFDFICIDKMGDTIISYGGIK